MPLINCFESVKNILSLFLITRKKSNHSSALKAKNVKSNIILLFLKDVCKFSFFDLCAIKNVGNIDVLD